MRKTTAILAILLLLISGVALANTYSFCVTDSGAPEAGLSPTWYSLKNAVASGADIGQPTIYEVGGGCYIYNHTALANQVGFINAGGSLSDADKYIQVYMTPDDPNIANLDESVSNVYAKVDTEVAAIKTVTDALPDSGALSTIQTDLDNLEGRLTATRAGYLDNISAGAVALKSSLSTAITNIAGAQATLDALNDFDPSSQEVDVGMVNGSAVNGPDDLKADVSGFCQETTALIINTTVSDTNDHLKRGVRLRRGW